MKKTNYFNGLFAGFILALMICSSNAFSQGNNWRLNGNNNVGQDDFIGTKNNADFVIRTNNRERIRVTTDNYTIFEDSVRIKGPLHIGDSSLVLGGGFPLSGTDNIQSSAGIINFGNTAMFNFSNIKVGIGLTAPQHKLHINDRNPLFSIPPSVTPNPVILAFTNQAQIGGTGATATDGFLVGIASDGTAELRQQENRAIRIFTNDGILNNQRMIISHDATTNVPRVGIGREDLLNPRTFLQIGQDINETGFGYRNWMNVGELVVDEKSSNMYFGFSRTGHIINWGSESPQQNGNRLRFVNTSGNVGVQSGDQEGLEIARMVSDGTTGRMGIGDFFTIAEDPTQVLDVIGNARLRELPATSWQNETLTKCLVVDDDGVLHWRSFDGSITGSTLGNQCDGSLLNPLLVDWEIPLDNHNFVFSGQGANNNRVGIGIANCQPNAKLDVLMNSGETGAIALKAVVEDGDIYQVGIYGQSTTSSPLTIGIGVAGISQYSNINVGVAGSARDAIPAIMDGTYNFGGRFMADYGRINAAGYFHAPSLDPNSVHNFGVYAICPPNPVASGVEFNWAGYFVGSVHVEGNITYTGNCNDVSDQQFKQDVHDYAGGIDAIRELRPVTYYYDTANYHLNFPTDKQYGLIAQEVEPFLPDLVSNQMIPAKFDTAGNVISESIQYIGLDYIQLTPILVQAVKELDENISVLLKIPEIPVLIQPQNNINVKYGTKLEFKWYNTEDTQYYIFDLAFDPEMSDIYYTSNVNDTVTAFEFTLHEDTTVYWAVRAANSYGKSNYSEVRHLNYMSGFAKSTSQSYAELSDINMKTDIANIEDALTKTMSLQGVSFSWDTINNPNRNLSEGTHLGLIAQEVQPVFPEVISTDANGYLYIDYSSLVPVLIESVKDLKYINDSLNQELNDLETRLNNIEQLIYEDLGDVQMKNTNNPAFQQEVTLENTKAIVLNQNVPNPFKEQTTISFQIPDNILSAKIVFIDNLGNILKQVEINDRGYGELIVYAHDLSAGHYIYYLVADDNTIESKRMVLTR